MTTTCANHTNVAASAFCRTCGKPLCSQCMRDVLGVIYCEHCLAARVGDPTATPHVVPPLPSDPDFVAGQRGLPKPTLAAFLGFIPGVGAFYNGQYQKGIIHVLMFATLITLANHVDEFGILFPFFFLYMAWDAYQTAKARVTGGTVPDPLGINNMFGMEDGKPPFGAQHPVNGGANGNTVGGAGIGPSAARQCGTRPPIAAFVLIGLGVLFLLGDYSQHFVHTFWPTALIAVGVWKGISVWSVRERL